MELKRYGEDLTSDKRNFLYYERQRIFHRLYMIIRSNTFNKTRHEKGLQNIVKREASGDQVVKENPETVLEMTDHIMSVLNKRKSDFLQSSSNLTDDEEKNS